MQRGVLVLMFLVTACSDDFVPREKVATIDSQTGALVLPHPCPDWSQSAIVNYDNAVHSNYGCAVNNNLAVQLENPHDLVEGRAATTGPDAEMGIRMMQRYRAGEIPAALVSMQSGQ